MRWRRELAALAIATCSCSSTGRNAPVEPGAREDPGGFAALRLHFARPFISDGEAAFPPLCPTGDDCFYSISVYSDGHIALDDNAGRVESPMVASDAERVEQLLRHETLRTTLASPSTDCPGLPADTQVYIATTVRRHDGTEVVFSDAVGCVAGEFTGRTEHPLYALRLLLNDELRWRYGGCPSADPATLDAREDTSRRPLCRVGFEAVSTR